MQVANIFDGGRVNRYQSRAQSNMKLEYVSNLQNITPSIQPQSYEATTTSYVVKSGDTLGSIARKLGVSWQTLYEDNKELIGNNPNVIYPGQELMVCTQEKEVSTPVVQSIANTQESTPVAQPVVDTQASSDPTVVVETRYNPLSPEPQMENVSLASLNTNSGTEIAIPSSVPQNGLTKSYTNYTGFKWVYKQKEVYDQWDQAGRQNTNGLAILNGRYLVAVTSKFGDVGDNIDIVLDDGQVISATVADVKNPTDSNYTEWGHAYSDGYRNIDVIEWETVVRSQKDFSIGSYGNHRVTKIINYNR